MFIFSASLSGGNNILQLFGLILVFILILVVTYYTTKFVGGVKMGITKSSNFKVIETFKLTQNKYLQLIQVGTRYFVIAVSKDNITFMTELKDDEIFSEVNDSAPSGNFRDIILTALKKQKEKKTDEENQES